MLEIIKEGHKYLSCSENKEFPARATFVMESDGNYYVTVYSYFDGESWVDTNDSGKWSDSEINDTFFPYDTEYSRYTLTEEDRKVCEDFGWNDVPSIVETVDKESWAGDIADFWEISISEALDQLENGEGYSSVSLPGGGIQGDGVFAPGGTGRLYGVRALRRSLPREKQIRNAVESY